MRSIIPALLVFLLIASYASASGVTIPSGITRYVQVTLTNNQLTSLSSNSQVMLSVNSLAYQSYEANNLQNIEFFYANGTIVPSWLEGNILNEETSNNLYGSQNTIYWAKIAPGSSFLGADAGNSIYMGFTVTSNNLFSNTLTGEAPQLSCSNPANTISGCGTNQYAKYDDGFNVFNTYLNFNGISSTAPSGWNFVGTGATLSINNGISITSITQNSAALESNTQYIPTGNVIDGYLTSTTAGSDELVGWTTQSVSGTNSGWWGINGNAAGAGGGGGSPGEFELVYVSSGSGSNVKASSDPIAPYVATASWQGSGAVAKWNYSLTESANSIPSATSSNAMLYVNNGQSVNALWIRTRTNPPSNIMPSISFGSVQAVVSISLSNTLNRNSIDVIANTPSDNGIITATCPSGDTCQILLSSNNMVLANGITTTTLPYNALPLGTTAVYTNDPTGNAASGNAYVNRVSLLHWVTVPLTNTQGTAIAGNTPLSITLNALNFKSWEANTLNNTVLYYSNGTVAYSWLEGNDFNEANNIISGSTNALFWFLSPPSNTYLPADTGTPTTNNIYIGFGATSNSLMDGNFTGEAPQLSPLYGEYDTGSKVFQLFYQNFAGTAASGVWNVESTSDAIAYVAKNSIGSSNVLIDTLSKANELQIVGIRTMEPGLTSSSTATEIYDQSPEQNIGFSAGMDGIVALSWGQGDSSSFSYGGHEPYDGILGYNVTTVSYNGVENIYYFDHDELSGTTTGSIGSNLYPVIGQHFDSGGVSVAQSNGIVFSSGGYQTLYTWVRAVPLNAGASSSPPANTAPTITTANSITANSIYVIAGSQSDNALIMATCLGSDTCQLILASNDMVLASGTTTATIPYNSLPLGRSQVHAYDLTANSVSGNVNIYRVSPLNSVQVTLTNSQSSAVAANTPLMLNINALNYSSWESDSLDNMLVYFQNGTVAYSWLEGNALSAQTPANQLIDSANVVIWFKSPPTNSFLAANTGVATTNTVYVGFVSTSTSLIDGNFTGEAPQLSSSYAQYDNGANVFNVYFNGNANTLNFTALGSGATASVSGRAFGSETINALKFTGGNGGVSSMEIYTAQSVPAGNWIIDSIFQSDGSNSREGADGYISGSSTSSEAMDVGTQFSDGYVDLGYGTSASYTDGVDNTGTTNTNWRYATLYSTYGSSTFTGTIAPQFYTSAGGYTLSTSFSYPASSTNYWFAEQNIGATPSIYVNYARIRTSPPNGVMPAGQFSPAGPSTITTTIPSGGSTQYSFSLSDNINSVAHSAAPVLTVNGQAYYQNQLPATFTTGSPSIEVEFACSVSIDGAAYSYGNNVYGLGLGKQCGQEYSVTAQSLTVIYALETNSSTTTIASTSSTTIPTTTIATSTTTVPITTIPAVSNYTAKVNVSSASPATVNVTPYMKLEISSMEPQSQQVGITIINTTIIPNGPSDYEKIFSFTLNTTSPQNVSVNATIEYNCDMNPGVQPFVLVNGTWQPIYNAVLLKNPCSISFTTPNGHAVGIFKQLSSAPSNSTSSQASTPEQPNQSYLYVILAVVLVIVLLALYLLYKRGHTTKRAK